MAQSMTSAAAPRTAAARKTWVAGPDGRFGRRRRGRACGAPGPWPMMATGRGGPGSMADTKNSLRTVLEVLAIVALVLVVQRVLLPRLGFST